MLHAVEREREAKQANEMKIKLLTKDEGEYTSRGNGK